MKVKRETCRSVAEIQTKRSVCRGNVIRKTCRIAVSK